MLPSTRYRTSGIKLCCPPRGTGQRESNSVALHAIQDIGNQIMLPSTWYRTAGIKFSSGMSKFNQSRVCSIYYFNFFTNREHEPSLKRAMNSLLFTQRVNYLSAKIMILFLNAVCKGLSDQIIKMPVNSQFFIIHKKFVFLVQRIKLQKFQFLLANFARFQNTYLFWDCNRY